MGFSIFPNIVLNMEPMSSKLGKEILTVAQMNYRVQCLDSFKGCYMYISRGHYPPIIENQMENNMEN